MNRCIEASTQGKRGLTGTSDIWSWASVRVSCLASAHDCIVTCIVWAERIHITCSVVHLTAVYFSENTNSISLWCSVLEPLSIFTFADHIRGGTRVRISSLAVTYHCIAIWIMRTRGVRVTAAIGHLTGVYKHRIVKPSRKCFQEEVRTEATHRCKPGLIQHWRTCNLFCRNISLHSMWSRANRWHLHHIHRC